MFQIRLAVLFVSFLVLLTGCATGSSQLPSNSMSSSSLLQDQTIEKTEYYRDGEILIHKMTLKGGPLEFEMLQAEVGHVTFVLPRSDRRTESDKDRLKRTARAAKNQIFQNFIARSLQYIPREDQGGAVYRDIGEEYFIYFSPSGEFYFFVADTSSREALLASCWTKNPPTPSAARALQFFK